MAKASEKCSEKAQTGLPLGDMTLSSEKELKFTKKKKICRKERKRTGEEKKNVLKGSEFVEADIYASPCIYRNDISLYFLF